jgi:CHAD domain-containing protein/CYTH domain-containing protein
MEGHDHGNPVALVSWLRNSPDYPSVPRLTGYIVSSAYPLERVVPLPDYLLDLPAEEAGRLIALSLLRNLSEQRPRVDDPDDSEALHDFRVALRRLTTTLKSYRRALDGSVTRRSRKRLRRLGQSSRESRDLEVHIEWARAQEEGLSPRQQAGLRWHLARLERRKHDWDAAWRADVAKRFPVLARELQDQLELYRLRVEPDPSRPRLAAQMISCQVLRSSAELERRLADLGIDPSPLAAHRTRLAAKALRYLIDPIARQVELAPPLLEGLARLQQQLGELTDSHALLEELSKALDAVTMQAGESPATDRSGGSEEDEADDARPGLLALTERLQERSDQALREVRQEWFDGAADDFFSGLTQMANSIAERAERMLETERKFLLRRLPETAQEVPGVEIEQGWLPGTRVVERWRKIRASGEPICYRTVKSGQGLTRVELEEKTSSELFEHIWPLTEGRRVVKRRRRVPAEGVTWEIDEFLDRELVLAEVELPSQDATVEVPEWLKPYVVREVTGDPEYSNRKLAR